MAEQLEIAGAIKSVISYQLSVIRRALWGMRSPPPTHKGALGGGRATTRI
ncbi:hypothetical protein [Scytonema sp. PRP1]